MRAPIGRVSTTPKSGKAIYYLVQNSIIVPDISGLTYAVNDLSGVTLAASSVGQVLDFSSGSYASAGIAPFLSINWNEKVSISARFMSRSNGTNQIIASKQNSSAPNRGWYLLLLSTGGGFGFIFALRNDNSPSYAIDVRVNSQIFNLNTWYHLILTYDGSGNASGVRLWVDNSEKSLAINTDSLGVKDSFSSDPFNLGSRDNGNLSLDGQVKHFFMERRQWSEGEALSRLRDPYQTLLIA